VRVCTGIAGILEVFGTVGVVITWLVAEGVPLNQGTVKFISGKVRLTPIEPEGTTTKNAVINRITPDGATTIIACFR